MNNLQFNTIPTHIAFIMDGNGRWAKKRFLPRLAGHKKGVETLENVVRLSVDFQIDYITVYAFSTENWKRPKKEVDGLMELLIRFFDKKLDALDKNGVKIKFIGTDKNVPSNILRVLDLAEKQTMDNKKIQLNIAFNYGSREEIITGVKEIASKCRDGVLAIEDIDEQIINDSLYTKGIPDPDLLIRTSGEERISNFLLWQISYSELYFTDVYWPDFDKDEYIKALREYNRRNRRYGGIDSE